MKKGSVFYSYVTPLYDVPYRSTPTVDEWNAVTVDEISRIPLF